ncbi:MAG: GLPGLI family protein [Limnohabitans sp.]|nr:GLPGLI family protein [Limnohabitans sp.]
MKFYCWFLLFLIHKKIGYSQTEEPILFAVEYQFIHVNDTNNKTLPLTKNMLLEVGKTNSKYENFSLTLLTKNTKSVDATLLQADSKVVTGGPVALVTSDAMNSETLYQLIAQRKLIKLANLGIQSYKIELPLNKLNWQIESDNKTIGTYKCQKAITTFSGRKYTAWFSIDLPYQNGPWKLWGLPGLILEAYDEKREVQFLFKSVHRQFINEQIRNEFFRPIKTTEEKFLKATQQFAQDPSGTVLANLPTDEKLSVPVIYQDENGRILSGNDAKAAIKRKTKKIVNNPIEL